MLSLLQPLGSGAMGHVFLVSLGGLMCAVKIALQSDIAAATYIRQGWQNLVHLECLHSQQQIQKKKQQQSVDNSLLPLNSSNKRNQRYFCRPLCYIEGDWISVQKSKVCGYIMEHIPHACQLTVLIWHFHRTIDPYGVLRKHSSSSLAAERLLWICREVTQAFAFVAAEANLFAFDFNPKNILVSISADEGNLKKKKGNSSRMTAMEMTQMAFLDPHAVLRVVAIDLDCSLTPPFSLDSPDPLLLEWGCGRKVVYSCPHVPSLIAAYILAVLAKSKQQQGQFARAGLTEMAAHHALKKRLDDPLNALFYCQEDEKKDIQNVFLSPASTIQTTTPTSSSTRCYTLSPTTETVSSPTPSSIGAKQSVFLYPQHQAPKDIPIKEHWRYGVVLSDGHALLQLLAFILCDLLDGKSLHNVFLEQHPKALQQLHLPTDVNKLFCEKSQIISCLCFSSLTKIQSNAIRYPTKDIEASSTTRGDVKDISNNRPLLQQNDRRYIAGIGSKRRSTGRGNGGGGGIDISDHAIQQAAVDIIAANIATSEAATAIAAAAPGGIAALSIWQRLELLPALQPAQFLPPPDLLGPTAAPEFNVLRDLLLQLLDPLPVYIHRMGSPRQAYATLAAAITRVLTKLDR